MAPAHWKEEEAVGGGGDREEESEGTRWWVVVGHVEQGEAQCHPGQRAAWRPWSAHRTPQEFGPPDGID